MGRQLHSFLCLVSCPIGLSTDQDIRSDATTPKVDHYFQLREHEWTTSEGVKGKYASGDVFEIFVNQCFAVEFRVNGKKSSRPVAKVSQLPLFAKFIFRSNGPYIKNVKWVSSGTIEEFKQLRSKLHRSGIELRSWHVVTDPALEDHVLAIIEAQSKGELQSESIVPLFQESEQVSEQQVAAAHSELH